MPETVASILSDSSRRERVLSQCDASDVLREALSHTEACMNHYYEVISPNMTLLVLLSFSVICVCLIYD